MFTPSSGRHTHMQLFLSAKWYSRDMISRGVIERNKNPHLLLLLRQRSHLPPTIVNASSRLQHDHLHRFRDIFHSNINLREYGSKISSSSSSSPPSLRASRRLRKVGYLLTATLTFLSLNSFAIYTHYHDDFFHSYYPFPIAFDVGCGPSMLPTIGGGDDGNDNNNLYLRDCWSHRFLWLDYEHCKKCIITILIPLWISQVESKKDDGNMEMGEGETDNTISVASTTLSSSAFNRPWRKGDVVTLYNPYTKSLVTKRIIGVGGEYVCAFGEYALELHNQHQQQHQPRVNKAAAPCNELEVGAAVVPHDARFPIPFCRMISSSQLASSSQMGLMGKSKQRQPHQDTPEWYTNAFIQVPKNHVWLEGDNPMHSTDSRHYGPIPESALRGRIVKRIWPLGAERALSSNRPPPPM